MSDPGAYDAGSVEHDGHHEWSSERPGVGNAGRA